MNIIIAYFFCYTRLQPCGDEHHKHHQPMALAVGKDKNVH
jgi:hypothetical protein